MTSVGRIVRQLREAIARDRAHTRSIGDVMPEVTQEVGMLEVSGPRPFAEPESSQSDVYTFSVPASTPPGWVLRLVERRRSVPGA